MMLKVKNNQGTTLLELIISLAILGILVSSFLGIQVSFGKYNQISSLNLKAGLYAGNLYEKAKGMSVPELSELASTGIIVNDDIEYVIETERYNNHTMNSSQIDLVINTDKTANYNCYGYGDSILEYFTLSGQGSLRIDIYSDQYRTTISFTDANGEQSGYQFITENLVQTINIFVNPNEEVKQIIHINIMDNSERDLQLYVYEYPTYEGNTTIQYNDQFISTRNLNHPFKENNISIYSRKTKTIKRLPIYLKIMAFQQDREKPICQRQGIIWIKP